MRLATLPYPCLIFIFSLFAGCKAGELRIDPHYPDDPRRPAEPTPDKPVTDEPTASADTYQEDTGRDSWASVDTGTPGPTDTASKARIDTGVAPEHLISGEVYLTVNDLVQGQAYHCLGSFGATVHQGGSIVGSGVCTFYPEPLDSRVLGFDVECVGTSCTGAVTIDGVITDLLNIETPAFRAEFVYQSASEYTSGFLVAD